MKKAIATAPGKPTLHIDMTPQEVVARQAEEDKWLAEKPMRDWLEEIKRTDSFLPGYAEGIIDAMDDAARARLAQYTLDKYNEKKQLRLAMPQ